MNKHKYALLMLAGAPLTALAQTGLVGALEKGLTGTLIYSVIGIIVMIIAVKVVDIVTPGKLFHQIAEDRNLPLAVFTSAVVIGIAIIIAAAIAG